MAIVRMPIRPVVYSPNALYVPQQVVGVAQLDLSQLLTPLVSLMAVVMVFKLIGKIFSGKKEREI